MIMREMEEDLARLHDRALIRMIGLVAFLCGGLVMVLRWAW